MRAPVRHQRALSARRALLASVAWAAFAVAAGACARGEAGVSDGGTSAAEPPTLVGRALTDTTALALPTGLAVLDTFVVVQESRSQAAVRVFTWSGRPVASTGGRGSGPGEFVDPADVLVRPGTHGEFWIYDARGGRLTPYLLGDMVQGTLKPRGAPVQMNPSLVVESPRWLDHQNLLALDPMLQPGGGRFALYRGDGSRTGAVGEPPPGEARISPFLRQQAFGGLLAVHPDHRRFVVASRFAGRMEVYDRQGRMQARMRVPDPFEPDLAPSRDGFNLLRGPRFRNGYVDVTVAGDRVLGLFSGQADTVDGANFGRHVHVFRWDGSLESTFRLDLPAFRVAADSTGRRLYAVRHDPYPQLVVYTLPAPTTPAASPR